jgi:hypothetical protein
MTCVAKNKNVWGGKPYQRDFGVPPASWDARIPSHIMKRAGGGVYSEAL